MIGKYSGRYIRKKESNVFATKTISWLGTFTSILGAFLVASGFFGVGYFIFGIGAILWLIVAKRIKNHAMFFLELVFLSSNVYGFFNLGF